MKAQELALSIINGAPSFNRADIEALRNAVNLAIRMSGAVAKTKFPVGSKVKWNSKSKGCVVSGTVTKINPKNIHVLSTDGVRWTVSPTLLSAA